MAWPPPEYSIASVIPPFGGRHPKFNCSGWSTRQDGRAVAPPHELRGSARSLTKNLRAHRHDRSRSSEQGVAAGVRRTFSAGLHRGDLRICCDGYIGDQYFSTLASVDGGDAPG